MALMASSEQPAGSQAGDATFHEVLFGESESELQRYTFEEFRELSLRKRVRLLMSMPSRFLSAEGVEIPRDAAMRFRQTTKANEATTVPADADGPGARLTRQLLESDRAPELCASIKLAETVQIAEPELRAALATGLLRAAKLLEGELGSTPMSWAAIRRFASLVPTTRLTEMEHFLAPGTEAETMQAALQGIWHALSVEQNFGLGMLAARSRQLLTKYLDADWLCSALARALTTDLLLAFSVLAPNSDEVGLRAIYKRVRPLADGVVLELARAEIDEALAHAQAQRLAITARLEFLAKLARPEDAG